MTLQNLQVSTVVCPCSRAIHAKAYLVEGLAKNSKKQLMCVQNINSHWPDAVFVDFVDFCYFMLPTFPLGEIDY